VRGFSALARDPPLFFRVHRCKPTILFRHVSSPLFIPVWM